MKDKENNKKFYNRFCPEALMKDVPPSVDFCIRIAEGWCDKMGFSFVMHYSANSEGNEWYVSIGNSNEGLRTNAQNENLADCIKTVMMMYPEGEKNDKDGA